jgi:hypothetical protein
MANLKGLASIVAELRVERTNLANQLRHVDAALSVLGKLNGGSPTRNRRVPECSPDSIASPEHRRASAGHSE